MFARRVVTAAASVAFFVSGVPVTTSAADAVVSAAPQAALAEPALSPDHAEIAFVSGGDVWSVPSDGGTARLLAAVSGRAQRPLYSPDGRRLAFVDTSPGEAGIYVLTLDGGTLRRLTHDDVVPTLNAWTADGRDLVFSSSSHNIAGNQDVYRVPVDGGTPERVVHEDYVNAMEAAPSPDGGSLAYVRLGFSQWWRRGHSHIDESELVIAQPATNRFATVVPAEAKNGWPMWAPDGQSLYYVSDRSGSDELWTRGADGRTRALTALHGGRVLWPTISRDGRMIAFERNMRVWTYDVASGATRELPVTLRGLPDVVTERHLTQSNRFSALDLSPDGKKIAFVARGRIFAASAEDGGSALQITTHDVAAYDLPVWAPDSRRIAFVIDRGDAQALGTYEFPDGPERTVTPPGHHDDYPHWSPDGKQLAFVRDGRELHLLDLATRADRVLARGVLDRRPFGDLGDIAFSPAGDWIAFVDASHGGFGNVEVVASAGGAQHELTFLPTANGGPLAWSPDGSRLFLVNSQRTENGGVAQIDLVPRSPRFREDQFRRLFRDEPSRPELPAPPESVPTSAPSSAPSVAPAPSPSAAPTRSPAHRTTIEFTNIRERATPVQIGLDVTRVLVTPDSKTLVLVADAAGQENLYAYSVDETSDDPQVAKQITDTPGSKTSVHLTKDGKSVFFLNAGRAYTATLDGKGAHPIALSAELDVNFSSDKRIVFDQAWSLLDRWYADPGFHGANWSAVRATYEPFALGARTPGELYRIMSLMVGELNSSHTGVYEPRTPGVSRYSVGRLGVDWDDSALARGGRLRVARAIPLGPAAVAHLEPGDEILAVNGTPVDGTTDIDALLANQIGKRTELRVSRGGAARTIVVLPVDRPAEEQLRYRAWVESRRAYVERASGGRLGYVHLYDMGEESLQRFYADLDVQNRQKAGVVVDIRNNEGGFVDPYVVDVLTRREYLTFRSRFGVDPPERTSLGERALDRPSVLVVNEHSLSDAENFTEAYRQLRAGPVVGEPTAGWIIFTSEADLADGGVVRLPTTRVIAHDGVDMELHPRPVDLRVADPPGSIERGSDPQLDAAVRALLARVGRR